MAPLELIEPLATDPSAMEVQGNRFFACSRLRHEYFVQSKGWVPSNTAHPGFEIDRFDASAIHLAVFQDADVLAYVRALPHDAGLGFMLDNEFSGILRDEALLLERENSVEMSRLVCHPNLRPRCGEPHPMELLLKLLYRTSLDHGFSLFYIVVEEGWIKPFARRFGVPFRVIGTPYTFPDGTRTVVGTATMEEVQAGMLRHSREKFDWYHL